MSPLSAFAVWVAVSFWGAACFFLGVFHARAADRKPEPKPNEDSIDVDLSSIDGDPTEPIAVVRSPEALRSLRRMN